jgi:hypothetical protein
MESAALAKLASADDTTLERYGELVLSATSVDEVLGGGRIGGLRSKLVTSNQGKVYSRA